MMTPTAALELFRNLHPAWAKNKERMDRIERWHRNTLILEDKPTMPKATAEAKELRDRAITPWLRLCVRVVVQSLYAEGYRSSGSADNAPAWAVWQANAMDKRQIAINRGAVAHGLSYVMVLPGKTWTGDAMPQWRGYSARRMVAFYQDQVIDEWPMWALHGESIRDATGNPHWRFRIVDDEAIYIIDADEWGNNPKWITTDVHGSPVCPVIRFQNEPDLDGNTDGEVEPYIDIAGRINQDVFDRLIVQRFGAWVVRYVTGLEAPDTDEEKRAERLRLSVEDILMFEGADTKVGTLPATDITGYIKAHDADVHDFAAVSQTPPLDLLGQLVNLSAEALAAAEAGKMRKVEERKKTLGESYEQCLRLSAYLNGDPDGAADFSAQLVWRDTESRSLSMVADALGKMVSQLGIPPEGVWERIPGVTTTDIEAWKKLNEDGDALGGLMRDLAAGNTSPTAE